MGAGITPTSGVPASRINLTPPIGSKGLPLTLILSDSRDDTFTGDTTGQAFLDDDLWASTASGSGTLVNPAPNVPRAFFASGVAVTAADPTTDYTARFAGITLASSAPRLNAELGLLEFGQAIQDLSKALHSDDALRTSYPAAGWSITEPGRYVGHPDRRFTSARPGNHTWQSERDDRSDYVVAADLAVGSMIASGSEVCTDRRFEDGGRVEAITHYSAVDLPSNALGAGYGDHHNSAYLTVLGSSPINQPTLALSGITAIDGSQHDLSCHWALNLGVRQQIRASGSTISSPDGVPISVTTSEAADSAALLGAETVQHLLVEDVFNGGGAASSENIGPSYVGRVDLGNHVVADSCGLVGFEGVISASAFFSVSKDADPDAAGSGTVSKTDELTYAGLNIQVHSGRSLRRNGLSSIVEGSDTPVFRYGSDGSYVEPMTDALKTRASRLGSVYSSSSNANLSSFSVLRTDQISAGVADIVTGGTWDVNTMTGMTNPNADAILGEAATGGSAWGKTTTVSSAFLAEGIPTRVRIVPSIVGYEDVDVAPGASKLAEHPAAETITFRKPIVDYHVLVSVAPRTSQVVKSNLDAASTYGDPTTRNNPNPNRLHTDADFSDLGAVIYHAVFRINPTTLEQVYFTAADAIGKSVDAGAVACPRSVMPRHTNITETDRVAMGWGLHQVTPFRPLASIDFPNVPRLCGTVEAGGFYQRGGVSHLFDAAAYGGELFVGADILASADLGVETTKDGRTHFGKVWGHGQIWPNGDPDPQMPPGQELLVFRYTPNNDPWHPGPKDTSPTDNPLLSAIPSANRAELHGNATYSTNLRTGYTITDEALLNWRGWEVHDWIFPQIEQMRYLGREDKHGTAHPASGVADARAHPTLHCSSLRILDDGQMVMLAVHRDHIGAVDEYPSVDVGYPPNPDVGIGGGSCPPGFFYSDGQCVPIPEAAGDIAPGQHFDPITGEAVSGDGPSPVIGSTSATPDSDAFSPFPTWSVLKANTSARSLILMWSPRKAVNGKIPRTYRPFDLRYEEVATGDGNREVLATQTWSDDRGWWSGSRIAWWYEESGQRSIPITYGCYPEARASHAVLPSCLPAFISDGRRDGYPTIQPSVNRRPSPVGDPATLDPWMTDRLTYLTRTRFVTTTVGFSDFGPGLNPHQELGWAGWATPADLYDPIGYGDGTDFFTENSAADQAKWAEFGAVRGVAFSTGAHNGYSHFTLDLSAVGPGYSLSIIEVDGAGLTVTPTIPFVNAQDLATQMILPTSPWAVPYEAAFFAETGQALQGDPGTNELWRTYDSAVPPYVLNSLTFSHSTLPDIRVAATHVRVNSIGSMRGPFAGWSYHGPLHYGISTLHHPYAVDRVFKQVHAGVGYDVPITLLAPGKVHARARPSSSNTLDLEVETPFHRTDTLALLGATELNAGFRTGVQTPPGATRSPLGQFYLRTNLWDSPLTYEPSGGIAGLASWERIHGPSVSGNPLYSFWSDHPTDHFHAGAIPILPGTDYDLPMIESNRYAPVVMKNVDRLSDLDALAVSEQLLASVDASVSQTVKPVWDSGAIVTAQALGVGDSSKGSKATKHRTEMAEDTPNDPDDLNFSGDHLGLGKGQRIVRTPEGTLHTFFIRRSAVNSDNLPVWTHYTKPLFGDLFWQRKSLLTNPDTANYSGQDEVGPNLSSLGDARLHGAAFASDSDGTIHAVIEVHADPDEEAATRAHTLYYTYAKRTLVTSNPEPVYDWDWTQHTPVIIQQGSDPSPPIYGDKLDLRLPSLVCDSQDRLHLAVMQVWKEADVDSGGVYGEVSRILYSMKLPDESTFPDFDQAGDGTPTSGRWQVASYNMTVAMESDADSNSTTGTSHAVQWADYPKVCLRGDDLPIIFYRGSSPDFVTTARRKAAIYTNIGTAPTGSANLSGVFTFTASKATHVVGLGPDANNSGFPNNVHFYDAIVDERDRAFVIATLSDEQTVSSVTFAPRQTYITSFSTRRTTAEQWTSTNGLGTTRVLLKAPVYDGTDELRSLDPRYSDVTLTTNGRGELHAVIAFRITGSDDNRLGAVFRDADLDTESAVAPLQWPAVPDTEDPTTAMYGGGYAAPATSPDWPDGGTYGAPTAPVSEAKHFIHLWIPSFEFDQDTGADDFVIRSLNFRWLSVPSLAYDATAGWVPIGSAQTLAGEENFPHFAPQVRYQRHWGFDASELDLAWMTNEMSWFRTPHEGSRIFLPTHGGASSSPGGGSTTGDGIPGYPSGA